MIVQPEDALQGSWVWTLSKDGMPLLWRILLEGLRNNLKLYAYIVHDSDVPGYSVGTAEVEDDCLAVDDAFLLFTSFKTHWFNRGGGA